MAKRSLQLGAALLAVSGAVATFYLLGLPRQPQSQASMFVVRDERSPGEALAVYPDAALLKKHAVSIEQFEAAFRAHADAVAKAIAQAFAETFAEPSEAQREHQPDPASAQDVTQFGMTSEAFREILETTRIERWAIHADGTHTVIEDLRSAKSPARPSDSVSADNKPSGSPSAGQRDEWDLSIAATTVEQAKRTFSTRTGIAWPDGARDVRFDENRAPLLGDGVFYIVFTVPSHVMKGWLDAAGPWGTKEWSRGPIPVEVACHCGFGHRSPDGWRQTEDGLEEYSGGAPEILAVLESEHVRYAALDRGAAGKPWYNGELLILDPTTGIVRYCRWDM
jgi:hypothetical protein